MLAVMRHLADVAALKSDPAVQRQALIDGFNDLLDTDCGFFYVGDEWHLSSTPHFTHQTITSRHDPAAFAYFANFGTHYPLMADPFCYYSVRDVGSAGRWTLRELLPDPLACRQFHEIMDLVGATRWRDGIVTHFRTGAGDSRIIGLSLHRLGQRKLHTPREKALATFALQELRRMYDAGHVAVPAAPPAPLPPRLRQVLDRVLAGRTPKAIARELQLSVWTVREHVQRLYRHFGVAGREELMARFTSAGEQESR
jgi:DNA-binding CsgD family transcriptional regulator